MRIRSSVLAVLGLALLAACDDAPVAPVAPQDPGERVVLAVASDFQSIGQTESVGNGSIAFYFGTEVVDQYKFTAVKRANGTVGGIFEFHHHYLGLTVKASGDIVCLAAEGNRIRMGGVVRETNFEEGIPTGSHLTWSFTDNGWRSEGAIDYASSFLGHDAAPYCAFGLPYPEYPLEYGDVVVVRE